ncbi:ABC transporter substrate-binding protein [Eubacteriales bacterium OttesenSCG-928-K08]|nr:ABC transporter substrate-binding protein [Eubacteriales bacterium OttesenSCG-928-K08]
MLKKLIATVLILTMALTALTACSGTPAQSNDPGKSDPVVSNDPGSSAPEVTAGTTALGGTLKTVETFMYPSLDPVKDYYSWHSQKYGLTESLFRLTDDIEVVPWLAEGLDIADNVATLTLKDGVCFSNGNPLTADMVKRNMLRLAENNKRFYYLNDFQLDVTDEKTLVITMPTALPTLRNELANPEFCMIDLDNSTDIDNNPICTGPFKVETFVPEGDLTLVRNENYWDGDVILDSVTFYAMSDEQSKLMAMQNGEIDAYDNITATDIEIYSTDPAAYQLFSVAMQARCYMFMNPDRLDASIREAITLVIDRETIAAFMGGVLTPTYGAFNDDTAYGKSQQPQMNLEAAKAVMEAGGYTLNASNVYEKDGKAIPTIGLYCYAARNIDKIAVLILEQLSNFGIPCEIKLVEDPDGTYMTDPSYEFDICFYRMTTDKTGDPMPFIEGVVMSGSYQDITGYGNAEADAKIEELRFTVDPAKRAEIANDIMKDYYAANVFVSLLCYNRNIVMATGVSNFSEANPYEYYGVTHKTTPATK